MELSEFLLLFTTTHTLLTTDGASYTTPDPTQIDAALSSLLSGAPWAPIFFILCTAALATMTTTSSSSSFLPISPDSALWLRLNKPVGLLNPMSDDSQWLHHCRMSYPAFVYLVEELRPYLVEAVPVLEVELVVAMVLNRLASGAPTAAVGELWSVGVADVVEYTNCVTSILASYEKLYSKYVVAPTGERLERIIKGFLEETGVESMGGAIGGTRIVVRDEPERGGEFRSGERGDDFSVLLQGVCDVDKVFWDVCCGAARGLSDGEHLKFSSLWTRLCENEVLQEPVITVQGKPIRPFLVGSKNYPLLPFLMKPFSTGQASSEAEVMFDAQLRKGHGNIVTAFGVLKNRWKILKNLNVNLESASQTILACCVLHNFCQLSNQSEPESQEDDALNHNIFDPCCKDVVGEEIRRVLFFDWLSRHHNPP